MQSFSFADGLLLLFIYLKMSSQIDWSWWWVILVPVLVCMGVGSIIGGINYVLPDQKKGGA